MDDLLLADQILTSNVTGLSYLKSIEKKDFDTNRNKGLDAIFEL
jgi:hypothetical protein